jgi:predicted RNase H-like nuclease (RuvC/YqgF family)
MSNYYIYSAKLTRDLRAREAKRWQELEELQARKAEFRKELQPEYTAVKEWMDAQMKIHGLNGSWMEESQKMIDALDARVAAVV